jgi:hypothetical protein
VAFVAVLGFALGVWSSSQWCMRCPPSSRVGAGGSRRQVHQRGPWLWVVGCAAWVLVVCLEHDAFVIRAHLTSLGGPTGTRHMCSCVGASLHIATRCV